MLVGMSITVRGRRGLRGCAVTMFVSGDHSFELLHSFAKGSKLILGFVGRGGVGEFGTLPASRYPWILATLIMHTLGDALIAGKIGVAFELLLTTARTGGGEAVDVGELKLLLGNKLMHGSLYGRR